MELMGMDLSVYEYLILSALAISGIILGFALANGDPRT